MTAGTKRPTRAEGATTLGDKTGIQWTDASWNPIVGCSVVSPGCTNCYAMKQAARLLDRPGSHYHCTTQKVGGNAVWTGKVAMAPEHILTAPLRWSKPRRVFVNSMGDLFHEDVPDEWIDKVMAVMALADQHEFQVLTKRAERMREYGSDLQTPFRIAKAIDALSVQRSAGQEEIQPVNGYPGYFASSHGHIYSEKRGHRRKLKPDVGEQGHRRVQLHRKGKDSRRGDRLLVHRIILETFVGPALSPDAQVRHFDGNPQNNAVANLRWGDQSKNWSDSKRHGSHRRYSKLEPWQVREIKERSEIARQSAEAIARVFDISATQIRNILTGKQWAVETPINWPLENCWLGVSVEDQRRADERIPILLDTPAAVRFVSAEPMLGPVNFTRIAVSRMPSDPPGPPDACSLDGLLGERWPLRYGSRVGPPDRVNRIDWTIIGGESGPGARPMDVDWVISIVEQCRGAGVACFVKQDSGPKPGKQGRIPDELWIKEYPNAGT